MAAAADFEQLVDLRQGASLYHQKRFANAEVLFNQVYDKLKQDESRDLERYSLVLDFLAQSKSLQGKHHDVAALMEERLSVATQIHGQDSVKISPMLAGLAEAYYRDGRKTDAIKMVRAAIAGLAQLDDAEDYKELAQNNLVKYLNGSFSKDELPMDLSDFHSRCESISRGDSPALVAHKMAGFAEVGVDYKPEGFWGSMFDMAIQGRDGSARMGDNYRRIFIPSSEREEVRADVCVVDQRSGIVISADNTVD